MFSVSSTISNMLYQSVDNYLNYTAVFIYSLFNDASSILDSISSNSRMTVNNELGRMWKEAVVD
jgi:hypothetical protein